MDSTLTCDLIALLIIFVVVWEFQHLFRSRKRPPGPIQLPLLGNLHQLAIYGAGLPIYEYLELLAKKYGKIFRFQAGVTSQVIVSDYDLIKEVSCNPSDAWINRHNDEWLLERSYGKPLGLLFSGAPGGVWKESRRFVLRTLRDFGFAKQVAQDAGAHEELLRLFVHIESGGRVDGVNTIDLNMHHLFSVPVLNIIWRMITCDRFEYDDPKLHELLNVMGKISEQYSLAGDVLMAFPVLRHVLPPLFGYGKERRIYEPRLLQEFQNLLNERRHERHAHENERPADLTDAFLKKSFETASAHSAVFSDQNFAVLAMDLFMAGAETTSNTLEFAFLYMILYPEVQARVHTEIDTIFGARDDVHVQYTDLARMPYTEATLLETMRFSTVVPFNAREISETARLGGYELPKGTMIVCNLHAVHFDEEFWGDPHVFRPERFLGADARLKRERLLPFGVGRRQCIGEPQARSTLFIFFVSFLRRYKFEPAADAAGGQPPSLEKRVGVTVAPLPFRARAVLRRSRPEKTRS